MRTTLLACAAVLLFCPQALGQEAAGDTVRALVPPPEKTVKKTYFTYLDYEMERIGAMDLYGVTSQLPKGYLAVKWDWGTIRAKSRYNKYGELGPVMEPLAFSVGDTQILNLDLGLKGAGGGHTFQMSYGFTGLLDWYIELPFTYMDIEFDPVAYAVTKQAGADGIEREYYVDPTYAPALGITDPTDQKRTVYEFLYETLPRFGRPTPATEFHGRWLLGDINTGFSWNVFRNKRFSVALTPRVFFPTGHRPNPNSNLMYGTGPELETGIGGWAMGFTQGYDLRIFQFSNWLGAVLSSEFTVGYAFQQEREYPTNFVTPDPAAAALDPQSFPDLSHLEGTFSYTPGWSLDWTAQLQIQLALLGIGIAYGVTYSQEPSIDADPAFISMIEGLELFGPMYQEGWQFGATLSLLPLYVPVDVAFQYRLITDGYNAIVFDDFWQITVKAYIPMKAMWEKARSKKKGRK
jgi:hypothetical protein